MKQEKSGITGSGQRKNERDTRVSPFRPTKTQTPTLVEPLSRAQWEFIYWMIPKLRDISHNPTKNIE